MSGFLAGKVWQSDLASHLKPLAAALADIANDDGTSIYPSVEYVAWLLGRSKRSVQVGLGELKQMGVLQVVAHERGGRGHATEYRLIEGALPKRATWRQYRMKKGAASAPFPDATNGELRDIKGEVSDLERVQLSTAKGEDSCTPTAKEPPGNRPSHPPSAPIQRAKSVPGTLGGPSPLPEGALIPNPDPWRLVTRELKRTMNPQSFDTWIARTRLGYVIGQRIIVRVPSPEWQYVSERFGAEIKEAMRRVNLPYTDFELGSAGAGGESLATTRR